MTCCCPEMLGYGNKKQASGAEEVLLDAQGGKYPVPITCSPIAIHLVPVTPIRQGVLVGGIANAQQ